MHHEVLNGCIFAYAADLPMSVLRMIASKQAFIGTYDATMIACGLAHQTFKLLDACGVSLV